MPDYKPSKRSGFPSSKSSGSGDFDWDDFLGVLAGFVAVYSAGYSIVNDFSLWPYGLMFFGFIFLFALMIGDSISVAFFFLFFFSFIFGVIGWIVNGGGLSPWGWITIGSFILGIFALFQAPSPSKD